MQNLLKYTPQKDTLNAVKDILFIKPVLDVFDVKKKHVCAQQS